MKKLKLLVNPLLLTLLVGIMAAPFVVSEGIMQPIKDAGIVAGFRTVTSKDLAIYPNYTAFDGYVSFEPTPIENSRFSDQLTLTSFRGQIAIYHQLYTIYNDSKTPIALRLVLNQLPLSSSFDTLILSLHPDNKPACTSIESDCSKQTIFMQNSEIVNRESQILVLPPTVSAQITISITGLPDYLVSTSPVTLDISLLANFSE